MYIELPRLTDDENIENMTEERKRLREGEERGEPSAIIQEHKLARAHTRATICNSSQNASFCGEERERDIQQKKHAHVETITTQNKRENAKEAATRADTKIQSKHERDTTRSEQSFRRGVTASEQQAAISTNTTMRT